MRSRILELLGAALLVLWTATDSSSQTITEIIDATGDGAGNLMDSPIEMRLDRDGNLFVVASLSDNAFRITQAGRDHNNHRLVGRRRRQPSRACRQSIALDALGNIYVTSFGTNTGMGSFEPQRIFRITASGEITQMIDITAGVAPGITFAGPTELAVDSAGRLYMAGIGSNNVLRVDNPSVCSATGVPCVISQLIDSTGDGAGNALENPVFLALGPMGDLYVSGQTSDNVFRITPSGMISEIIDRHRRPSRQLPRASQTGRDRRVRRRLRRRHIQRQRLSNRHEHPLQHERDTVCDHGDHRPVW